MEENCDQKSILTIAFRSITNNATGTQKLCITRISIDHVITGSIVVVWWQDVYRSDWNLLSLCACVPTALGDLWSQRHKDARHNRCYPLSRLIDLGRWSVVDADRLWFLYLCRYIENSNKNSLFWSVWCTLSAKYIGFCQFSQSLWVGSGIPTNLIWADVGTYLHHCHQRRISTRFFMEKSNF